MGRYGRWHWRFVFAELQRNTRQLLRALLGSRVSPGVGLPLSQSCEPFSKVGSRD